MNPMDIYTRSDRESTVDDELRAALKRHGVPVSPQMMMLARMRLEQYALEQQRKS